MTPALTLWVAAVIGITLGGCAASRRNKRIRRDDRRAFIARRDDPFSSDTEAAISEALEVAHEDVDGIEDYRIVALRRDLELWGRQS